MEKSRQICFSRNASGYAGLQEMAAFLIASAALIEQFFHCSLPSLSFTSTHIPSLKRTFLPLGVLEVIFSLSLIWGAPELCQQDAEPAQPTEWPRAAKPAACSG